MHSAEKAVSTQPLCYTVLIAGAVSTRRELYRHSLLTDSGDRYTLLTAESAAAALEICQHNQIDVLLIGDQLSDTSGLAFLQGLQASGAHPPVVMVADDPHLATAVEAMKLGAKDYLVGPTLTSQQLQSAVQSAIASQPNASGCKQAPSAESAQSQHWEDALQERNWELENRVAELQALIDIIPMGIAIATDPACTQMRCNTYIQQLLGVAPESNISKSAPADEQPTYRVFQSGQEIRAEDLPMQQAARLGVDVRDTEIEVVLSDGTTRQILAYATPLRNQQSEIRGAVGAFLDITTRKQAEAQLQQSLENITQAEITLREQEAIIRQQLVELEGIYATAPVGLCFQDVNLRYVRINDRLAEINGVPAADHLGQTLHEVLPDLADTIEPIHRRVIETGEPILNVEIRGTTRANPDVEHDWIASYYPLKEANGRALGVNVVVQDVTAAKQALAEREQLLRQIEIERSFLEQTLQQMPLGVAIAAAPTGGLLFHNDEAVRLLRHPIHAANADSEYAYCGGRYANGQPYAREDYPITRSALTGEVVKAEEMLYQRGDGTHTIFSVNAAPIVDQAEQRIAAVCTFEDISRRKQLEQEREQLLAQAQTAQAEAEAANSSKDEFVSLVAHELRSPLTAIVGWINLLQTRSLDPATTKRALETIARNTHAQAKIIEDLLDISRVVRGTLHLAQIPINLADVVEAAIATIHPTADAKELQLDVQIHTPARVLGDFNRLQQV
ncbi:MAG TPA: PAS domain-containing protein, partial [Trichocoleus sp.]